MLAYLKCRRWRDEGGKTAFDSLLQMWRERGREKERESEHLVIISNTIISIVIIIFPDFMCFCWWLPAAVARCNYGAFDGLNPPWAIITAALSLWIYSSIHLYTHSLLHACLPLNVSLLHSLSTWGVSPLSPPLYPLCLLSSLCPFSLFFSPLCQWWAVTKLVISAKSKPAL